MQREVRKHFYKDATDAMQLALGAGRSRIRLKCVIPELNVETDVYRVGTLLEMVRDMATALAQDGKRVKVCVQAAMGQGVLQGLPLSLNGVKRIMASMDWGDAADFVSLGAVGAAEVDESDYYILVAPQNVVGDTIMTSLGEHVAAAEAKGKSVVLVNPVLKDLPSHSGIMGVRGRAERMAFADSFDVAYHFRLLFLPGSWYPIMGALRYVYGKQWEVFKRADIGRRQEEYQLIGSFDHEPSGAEITKCFEPKRQPTPPGRWW